MRVLAATSPPISKDNKQPKGRVRPKLQEG